MLAAAVVTVGVRRRCRSDRQLAGDLGMEFRDLAELVDLAGWGVPRPRGAPATSATEVRLSQWCRRLDRLDPPHRMAGAPLPALPRRGPRSALPAAVPVVLTSLTTRHAPQRLVSRTRTLDWGLATSFSQLPRDGDNTTRQALESTPSAEPSSPVDEIRQRMLSRKFLDPRGSPAESGWIERLLWRCWVPWERLPSEMAFPSSLRWTTTYHRSAMLLVVLVSLACLAEPGGHPGPGGSGWVLPPCSSMAYSPSPCLWATDRPPGWLRCPCPWARSRCAP